MPDNISNGMMGAAGIPLSQYTSAISNAVHRRPELMGAWVIAELSDVRLNSGGHCYMELIEKDAAGRTIAKLKATIWQNTFRVLRKKFYDSTGKDIVSGLKVLLKGSANHHSLYGLSFNIIDIDPSYTLGDMERLRREILNRLALEGILDNNKKTDMPVTPQRIAVISAEGAAGYGDFMNQLLNNPDGFVFYPCLFPCVMQGDKVSASIRAALEMVEATIDLWDCVAIMRGGGATTDLNGFDDYELAKAVANFKIPVVVGIGHERDRTVLDEIAHTRMKTPTAVAAFFVDSLREAFKRVQGSVDRIIKIGQEKITGEMRHISTLESMVPILANSRIESANSRIDKIIGGLPLIVTSRIGKENSKLQNIINVANAVSRNICLNASRKIDDIELRVRKGTEFALTGAYRKLDNIAGLVKVLDPANTLKRGYSITRLKGKALNSAHDIKEGEKIVTTLCNGEIESIVTG